MNDSINELIFTTKSLISEFKAYALLNNKSSRELEHLSIEEVAEIMHISQNSVRNFIKDNEIKTFKYKGILRVRKIALERFITKHTI